MQRGASVSYLSCFPEEDEWIYPPNTFLQVVGRSVMRDIVLTRAVDPDPHGDAQATQNHDPSGSAEAVAVAVLADHDQHEPSHSINLTVVEVRPVIG